MQSLCNQSVMSKMSWSVWKGGRSYDQRRSLLCSSHAPDIQIERAERLPQYTPFPPGLGMP
jgi:hypothetical protein